MEIPGTNGLQTNGKETTMLLPVRRAVKYALVVGYAMCNLAVVSPAAAQFHLPVPSLGGKKGKNQPPPSSQPSDSTQPPLTPPDSSDRGRGKDKGGDAALPKPAGVPVPLDSPIMQAFQKLSQQSIYHQRMNISADDPRMQQIMAQMGFMPAETITAGDTKMVSMHFKLPFEGQPEDFELRSVSRSGRVASKWVSPAKDRILAKQDAEIAKQLAQSEAQSASSVARNLAMGPMGIVSAAVQAGAAAASASEAAAVSKQAHDFWEWKCREGGGQATRPDSTQARPAPPLTDLRVMGNDTINDMAVTNYEFYVRDGGQFHGPMQMAIAKGSGLPVRIGMSDPRAGGSMQMDYFGFNQGGDFEVPDCLAGH
jgi:hypothetical protein